MKYIWSLIILISISYGIISNNYSIMYDKLIDQVSDSLMQTLRLISIIMLWSPLFKILDESNVLNYLIKPFKAIVRFTLKDKEEVINDFSKSLLVSSFGLSEASLTYTFSALNKCKKKNRSVIALVNMFPITIFPQTILTLRKQYNSQLNIWPYISLVTIIMFLIAILYTKIRYKNE